MARPPFWMVTVIIDALFFGPFYVFAIYAFIKKKNWIRDVSIIWSTALIVNVLCILSEEIYGINKTHELKIVILLNTPWLVFPIINLIRMLRNPIPWNYELEENKIKDHLKAL